VDYTVTMEGKAYQVTVEESGKVSAVAPRVEVTLQPPLTVEIRAKLQGIVYEIFVVPGDRVGKGDTLMILEAMKMETAVVAAADGNVVTVEVEKNQVVKTNQLLVTLS